MELDLDKEFKKAFDKITKLNQQIAPDVKLKFYAYYKQASCGNKFYFNRDVNLINAFKLNAWIQLNGMSADEAKKEYIKLSKQF